MNDFFSRLESELGALTRHGTHLTPGVARRRRRVIVLLRRGAAMVALAVALAASFDSEFPATAHGYPALSVAAAQA